METVKNLLKMNMSISDIAQAVNLSVIEIEKLRNEIKNSQNY